MFVADETLLDLDFRAAAARFAILAQGGGPLTSASEEAYGDGLAALIRVGPLGTGPVLSKLVEVRFLDVVSRAESAVLTLRWEATGPGGRLFPVLDADITLTPAGADVTRLSLAGAYRPPFAALGVALDKAILRRIAAATMRSFLGRVADAVAQPQAATPRAASPRAASPQAAADGARAARKPRPARPTAPPEPS